MSSAYDSHNWTRWRRESDGGRRKWKSNLSFHPSRPGNVAAVAFVFGLYVFVVVVGLVCGIAAGLA